MLRKISILSVFVIFALLMVFSSCDTMDRDSESPVGVTNDTTEETDITEAEDPGILDSGEEREDLSVLRKDPLKWPLSLSDFQWPFSSYDYIHRYSGARWRISCGYNCSDYHRDANYHSVDLVRYYHPEWTYGSPVLAPARGVIVFSGWKTGYGWCVIMDHDYGHTGRGYKSIVAHLTRDPKRWVNVGNDLRAGTFLGFCGTSGYSTGPHIHFCVWKNGWSVSLAGISGYYSIYEGGRYYSLNRYVRPPANPPF